MAVDTTGPRSSQDSFPGRGDGPTRLVVSARRGAGNAAGVGGRDERALGAGGGAGWRVWYLARNPITIAHEGGHALVSVLSGRRLERIQLHSGSGETVSRGARDGAQGHARLAPIVRDRTYTREELRRPHTVHEYSGVRSVACLST